MQAEDKKKYRASKAWKDYRKRILHHHNYTCYICGIKKMKGLQIHHLNPNNYGQETMNDCIPLCAVCHKDLIERLLKRTKNPVDIDKLLKRIKEVYYKTKENI